MLQCLTTYSCVACPPQQLAKTLSALEEEKEAAKLSHFEERHRQTELQEKYTFNKNHTTHA